MEYVMVPVPEELVPEVRQFLQWNTDKTASAELDDEGAARFVGSLDEVERRFLLVVADAAVNVTVLTAAAAAEAAGCTQLETLGLMMTLNHKVAFFGKVPWGLVHRAEIDGSADEHGVPEYSFNMPGDLARTILDAARGRVVEF